MLLKKSEYKKKLLTNYSARHTRSKQIKKEFHTTKADKKIDQRNNNERIDLTYSYFRRTIIWDHSQGCINNQAFHPLLAYKDKLFG